VGDIVGLALGFSDGDGVGLLILSDGGEEAPDTSSPPGGFPSFTSIEYVVCASVGVSGSIQSAFAMPKGPISSKTARLDLTMV